MKECRRFYVKKDNVGYEFIRGYKYDTVNGSCNAVDNTYSVVKTILYGLTWTEDHISFSTPEEGNEYYKKLAAEGFSVCTKEDYMKLRPYD